MSYRCVKCGNELSDGAKFCPVCGEVQPKREDTEPVKKAKGKIKKIAALLILFLVFGSGSIVFSHQRSLHPMPDLIDMNVQEAVEALGQEGIDDSQIIYADENGDEITKQSEWFVVNQEPSAGSQIDIKSDEVVLTIFDQLTFEADQIQACAGGKLYQAVQTAEEYDYRIDIQADDPKNPITTTSYKNSPERRQKEWVVTQISDINKSQKTVTFIADTEANIAAKEEAERLAKAEAALKQCGGMSVPEALETADEWRFEYTLFNYGKEDCTKSYEALDEEQQDEWLVLKVQEIKREESTVAFIVDTKDNIAAREKDKLKACVKKSVVDAQEIIDKLNYTCDLVNYDGKEYTSNFAALSTKEKAQWVVLAVSGIDTDEKTLTVSMDTKKNIEARRKAAEEKKKKEAEKKKKAAAAAAKAAETGAAATTRSNTSGGGEMVWIPRTGHKYHSNPNCSNMKNPSQVSLSQAISMGYDACKKCY